MKNLIKRQAFLSSQNKLNFSDNQVSNIYNERHQENKSNINGAWDKGILPKRSVPIQLMPSNDNGPGGLQGKGTRMLIDTRLRKGPYFHLSQEAGCQIHSVYNKTYHPRAYIKPEDGGLMKEYEQLTEHVTMWNVAVERQIRVKGPDALKFVDYVITRKAEKCKTGFCKQVILTNYKGGIVNDPILLRPHEDEWWFSIADSDVLLYLQGINHRNEWNVEIDEIDVSPVQIQGPKSTELMTDIFGEDIKKMAYYQLLHKEVHGFKCVISRTGFSTETGYEIYLYDSIKNAEKMWYTVLDHGKAHNLHVIAPGHHRRIEAGILSQNQDIDIEVNPQQCGMGWQVDLKKDDFVGKEALAKIKQEGITHKLAGFKIYGGDEITQYNQDFQHVLNQKDEIIGYVTSAWYSKACKCNIAMGMLPVEQCTLGTEIKVVLPELQNKGNGPIKAEVVPTPFKMPAHDEKGTGLKSTGSKL